MIPVVLQQSFTGTVPVLAPSGVVIQVQSTALSALAVEITGCRRCPRLISHIENIARTKRRAYKDWPYWGKPVPGFGDPAARLLVVGLAPAAHGANRTGRMFTGDASGDWLMRALFRAGFANQPYSTHAGDGLTLTDAYITAVCRCAPPENRPTAEEIANCSDYLRRELDILKTVAVIICLGQVAYNNMLRLMRNRGYGWPVPVSDDGAGSGSSGKRRKPPFRHGAEYRWIGGEDRDTAAGESYPAPVLLASYHPSRQNTNTGVLTEEMFDAVFRRARMYLSALPSRTANHVHAPSRSGKSISQGPSTYTVGSRNAKSR